MGGLEVIKVGKAKQDKENYVSIFHNSGGIYSNDLVTSKTCAYTALEDYLFLQRGIYNSDKGVPIIFDSGCTHAPRHPAQRSHPKRGCSPRARLRHVPVTMPAHLL